MKLNLGCGSNKLNGFLNIDVIGDPDYKYNLEDTPWPFADADSVDEIVANHVLEHIGRETSVYFAIIKEIYRVCQNAAIIHVAFPHHRHDNAVDDPSHVRQLTIYGFGLFDQARNRKTRAGHHADSTLGLDLGVDFFITNPFLVLEKDISDKLVTKELTEAQVEEMIKHQNNIVKEVHLDLVIRKDGGNANLVA